MESRSDGLKRVVICGGGLAAAMTAAALSRQFAGTLDIGWLDNDGQRDSDLFYGSVATPSAYAFNLAAGVSEPRLLLDSDTAFCWGTRYIDWGPDVRSWIQCFHLPLPVVGGVLFHQHLARLGERELEPFLMSAAAARAGVFAHPAEKSGRMLGRAEYGYQFDAASYASVYRAAAKQAGVRITATTSLEPECDSQGIVAIKLADGSSVSADLYIDCTGPEARLLSRLGVSSSGTRKLRALQSRRPAERLGRPCRTLTGHDFGWQSETSLQGNTSRLTMFCAELDSEARRAHGESVDLAGEISIGYRAEAWRGNCVAIGQSAGVLEPLTPAPMLLLQRGIERLLMLIPHSHAMSVERREFNRQHGEDHAHAALFNRALFETSRGADTPYWRAARAEPLDEKLARKISQFESHGVLANFDLEPFNSEDWIVLHLGMGRRAARHDRFAEQVAEPEMRKMLADMRRQIDTTVKSLPSHHDYTTGLVRYLKQNNW